MRRRHNLAHRMNQRQTSSVWEATFQFQKWLSVGAVYLLIHVCSCAIHPKALSWRWSSATENQRHVKKAAWAEDPGLRLTRSLSGQVVANLSSPHSGAYVKYYHITRSNNTLTVTRFLIKSFGNHRRHLFFFFPKTALHNETKNACWFQHLAWLSASRFQSSLCERGHSF